MGLALTRNSTKEGQLSEKWKMVNAFLLAREVVEEVTRLLGHHPSEFEKALATTLFINGDVSGEEPGETLPGEEEFSVPAEQVMVVPARRPDPKPQPVPLTRTSAQTTRAVAAVRAPQSNGSFVDQPIHIGKHKGMTWRALREAELQSGEMHSYLQWAIDNMRALKDHERGALLRYLQETTPARPNPFAERDNLPFA